MSINFKVNTISYDLEPLRWESPLVQIRKHQCKNQGKNKITDFWDKNYVKPAAAILYPKDGGSRYLQNIDVCLPNIQVYGITYQNTILIPPSEPQKQVINI